MAKLRGQQSLIEIPPRTVLEEVRERMQGFEWRQKAREARRVKRRRKRPKGPAMEQSTFWSEETN